MNQPGSQLFSAAGANVFQALSDLATTLQSNSSTTDDIANATNEVRAAYDQLNSARTFYGSTLDQLNASQDFLNSEKLQLTQQSSDLVGVDAARRPPIWPMPKRRATPSCKPPPALATSVCSTTCNTPQA